MDSPMLLLKNNPGIRLDSEIFVIENPENTVGRDDTADLRIPDPFVSRRQAEIFCEDERWYIKDDQSKNGTFVNDVKIGPDPVQLHHNDIISFCRKIDFIYLEDDLGSCDTISMPAPAAPYGILMIDKTEDVIVDGVKINPRLGPQEWQLLSLLWEEPDRIHTYEELARKIYMIEDDIFALPPYIKLLQMTKNDICKKIRKAGITREVIKSRNGVGYQLVEKASEG